MMHISKKRKMTSQFLAILMVVSLMATSFPSMAYASSVPNTTPTLDFSSFLQFANLTSGDNQSDGLAANSIQSEELAANQLQTDANSNLSTLSQEEIDKIVNDHMAALNNSDKTLQQTETTSVQNNVSALNEDESEITDRFIVKYINENQKENTVKKVKGSIKERLRTKNQKFDVYITNEKMKREDLTNLLKEKKAETNIEYIQPDYQVTVASVDQPQTDSDQSVLETSQQSPVNPSVIEEDNTLSPMLINITFDGLKIKLVYDEILDATSLPASSNFVIKNTNAEELIVASVNLDQETLTLTLASLQAVGEPIYVSYILGINPIQNQLGNDAEGFSDRVVQATSDSVVETETPIIDIAAPFIEKSEGKDNILNIKYNEALLEGSIPQINDFAIVSQDAQGNPQDNTIESIAVTNQEVRVTLENSFEAGQTISFNYTPGANPIKDLAGNPSEAVSDVVVDNLTEVVDITTPVLIKATINANRLQLMYNEDLDVNSILVKEDFILVINDKDLTESIKSITIHDNKVMILLTDSVITEDTVSISYPSDKTQLRDLAGNMVPEITNLSVDNITISEINDPRFVEQWGLQANAVDENTDLATSVGINASEAWQESEGSGVVVAVLDTGIDITHEDLKENIWENTAEIPDNGLDDDGNGYIDDIYGWNFADKTNAVHNLQTVSDEWHGTHVAGIIAAVKNNKKGIAGVSPQAKIMPLQVFKNGVAYTSDILSAIEYAKQNGAQIVNCSWGTTSENIALKEAIEDSELLFVCAAGNSNRDIDINPVYPASLSGDNIISVASVKETGNLSRFSNYGVDSVDVAAPGEEILSTTPGNTYGVSGGTSQAAAFVTGEVALILAKYPDVNMSELRSRVLTSSDELSSLSGKTVTAGLINCYSALDDPVNVNDSIIQIPEEQVEDSVVGSSEGEGYDLYAVDDWNVSGHLAIRKSRFGTAVLNDKIYIIGGYINGFSNRVVIYDPISDTSTTGGNMSDPRSDLAVAVTGGKIYAFGGLGSNGFTNKAEVYDPTTNTWSTIANMPTVRSALGAAAVNGIIYVIGGANGTSLNKVEAYNPATNTWSTKASMATARFFPGVAAVNNKIYAFGGTSNNTLELYDPVSNTWTTKASMPNTKQYFGTTVLNDKIYAFGGTNSSTYSSNTYEYDTNRDTWTMRSSLSPERTKLGAATVYGKIYALGGIIDGEEIDLIEGYGLPSSSWSYVKNMPTARADFGAVDINGKIYAIGGRNGNTYLNTVEVYDKSTDAWSTKANMTTARCGLAVETINGKIYAVGGYNGSYLSVVEEYDPVANTWTSKASLPEVRAYFGITSVDSKLYVAGGYNGTSYLKTVRMFDSISNTWTNKAIMYYERAYLGLTAVNGKIYAIGGYYNTTAKNAVEEYNIAANIWTTKTSMREYRKGLGVEVIGGKIYAFGGIDTNDEYQNTVEKYDPYDNTWVTLDKESMNTSRERFASVCFDGKIYALGGYDGIRYLNTSEEYISIKNVWSLKATMPTGSYGLGSVMVNNKIYAIGGYNNGYKNTVYEYNQSTNTWSTKASMPTARRYLGVVALDNKIYAIGGYNGNYLNTVEVYDPSTNTWSTSAPGLSVVRQAFGVATVNGKIYVFGGYNGTYLNSVEEYNPTNNTWTTKAHMNIARGYLAGGEAYNKIYAIGGKTGTSYLNSVEEYNPSSDSWSTKKAMPTARESLSITSVNGKIYALGGYSYSRLDNFEEYDVNSDSWSKNENMPIASVAFGCANLNGKIYALGGYTNYPSNQIIFSSMQEFDLNTYTWETLKDMPTARRSVGVGVANGKIYAIGGGSSLSVVEEYDPALQTWKTCTNMPTGRSPGVATLNNQIYAIGGNGGNVEMYDPITDIWSNKAPRSVWEMAAALNGKIYVLEGTFRYEYDPLTNVWIGKVGGMPTARNGFALAVANGKLYAIGGSPGFQTYTNKVEAYDPLTDTWSTMADMPTPRADFGVAVVNDHIYAIGGTNGDGNSLDCIEEYDPFMNCWSIRSSLPTGRAELGAAELNGKIYVIGGVKNDGIALGTVEVYDPALDSYSLNINQPSARSGIGAAELNGKIYAAGGTNGSTIVNTVEVLSGDTWSVTALMPTARKDLGLIAVNGLLYAVGGFNGSAYLKKLEVYNPETNTWVAKADMPTARSSFGITTVNGRIYVIGGYNGSALTAVEEYNPLTNQWISLTSLPAARYGLNAVNINDTIYAIGGINSKPLSVVEVYDPILQTWTSSGNMSIARYGFGTSIANGKVYTIGGYDGNNYLSVCEEYDPITKIWSYNTPTLAPRAYFGAVGVADNIYLIGGCNGSGLLNTVEKYSTGVIAWNERPSLPTAREDLSGVEFDGKLYAIGGKNSNGNLSVVEQFDSTSNSWISKTSMTTLRYSLGVAAANGKIYAIGGKNENILNVVEEYDPVNNTWSNTGDAMPTPRFSLGVVSVRDKIYAIGGNNGSYLGVVEEYDPINGTWDTTKTSMNTARDSFGIATANGKIYIVGGYNGSALDTVEEYDPLTDTWTYKTDMPTARYKLGAASVNGKIYAIGGYNSGKALTLVEVYDPVTNLWKAETGMPIANYSCGTTTKEGKIYVFGGKVNQKKVLEGFFNNANNVDELATLTHLGEMSINTSGNYSRTFTDMSLDTFGFKLNLTRTYNSSDDREEGYFGKGGWSFGFQGHISDYRIHGLSGKMVRLPDGSALTFIENDDGTFTAENSHATLVDIYPYYILTTLDQYTYNFHRATKCLESMKDRNGNVITITNSRITDQSGREINIEYNTNHYITSITDPLGRIVQYRYNSKWQLSKVIDPEGKCTNYTYDADNYLISISDNDNQLIESVVYDSSGGERNMKIARLTDASGNIKTYMYSMDLNQVTEIDSNGRQKITWYDAALYPIQVQEADGRRSTTVYALDSNHENKYGEVVSTTDRNGNRTVYVRDERGNIIRSYNPDASYQELTYDEKNNLLTERDEGHDQNQNGMFTQYIFDSNKINLLYKAQRLTGSATFIPGTNDANFAVTAYTYYTKTEANTLFNCNADGLLKTETDPNGHVTTYTYDMHGNIKTIKDAENKTTTYNYNTIGWKTSEVTPKGYTTSYVYDMNGNLEKQTLQGGEVTRITYDNQDRKTKEVSANLYNTLLDDLANHTYSGDHGERYTYYPNGKVHTLTDSAGNITSYTYDFYGNVSTETKPNGSIIEYYYDSLDRLITVKFRENAQSTSVPLSSYTYLIFNDGRTQKTVTKYLNGSETAIWEYIYDYKNRLLQQKNPDGTSNITTYNDNGTVYSTTDERNYTTYYRYDYLNRNTKQWIPSSLGGNGNTLYTYKEMVYDKAGNIITIKTGKTALTLFASPVSGDYLTETKSYYNNNKLKSESDSAGRKTEYQYDNDGYLSKKDVYTTATTKNTTEYVNNYFGIPVTVKEHVRSGDLSGNDFSSNTNSILTTANTFDKNGNILTITRPNNVVITYTYDAMDRQTGTRMPGVNENNTAVTITTSTTYDWAGKVLTQTDANNHTTTNTYDKQERLIKVTDALGYSSACYYDLAGRLIAEVSKNNYDPNKTLSEMSRTEYTYDSMDRVKMQCYIYLDPITSQWMNYVAKAYQYDAKGNLIKELDALGYEAGIGTSVEDKINSGYGTQYSYDPANRVKSILDPVSQERSLTFTNQYGYDGAGRKICETNAAGVITSYSYDDANRLLTTQVNNQTQQTNTFDLAGNLLSQTDGNGNTNTFEYNAWNKLKKAIYPGDTSIPSYNVIYQYDVLGNLKKTTNSAGPVDLYTYDKQNRELSHTQQKADATESITTSVRYDKFGNPRFVVDGNNVTTENTYNVVNKLSDTTVSVTDINNATVQHITTYGYDKNGNQTTKTEKLGTTTISTFTNVYDPMNRLIEKKDPLNISIEKLAYNHNNAQITSTDALNKVTQFTYDKNNRLLSTIDPLNHTKSQTYDNVGSIHTKTDGESNVTIFNYDVFNRLSSVVNAKNETTSYTYDLNDNMLTQTDGANHTTIYEYNVANKVTKKIDHGGRSGTPGNYTYDLAKTERYTYDALGNLLTKVDRNNVTTTYTYDVHNRMLSQVAGAELQSISYTYDGNGNQLTVTDGTGSTTRGTTTRTYDQLNRTKTKTILESNNSFSFTFLYDVTSGLLPGQKTAEIDTDPKGNVTTQAFDAAGRMISVTVGGNTTTYTYYDNGSKKKVVYPGGNYEEYTYADDGLLQTLTNKRADQSIIDAYIYFYDAAHNQTSKIDAKGTTTYDYDDLNRLETVTEPGQNGKVTTYTYEPAGNRATQTETTGLVSVVTSYTYNEQNRLTNILTQQNNVTTQTVAYLYDNNGNQLTATKVPYINGIPQTAQITTNTYDCFNQLSTTSMPDGTNITNTYNGEGYRTAKQVNGTTTKYLYIADKVVLELDGSNTQTARSILGTNLIARTVSGTTLYYMYNGHADVTALIDATGTVQASYYYDAFGNVKEQTGNFSNNILYAGYQYDKETGLYYCNARMYDPVIARFLTEDTVTGDPNDPLSLNLYTYCHNEPLMYSDLSGHREDPGGGALVDGDEEDVQEQDITRYLVQDGDNLSEIAEEYKTTVDAIAEANYISDPYHTFIHPGDSLVIPGLSKETSASSAPINVKSTNDVKSDANVEPQGTSEDRTAFDTYVNALNRETAKMFGQYDESGNPYVTEQQAEWNRTGAFLVSGVAIGGTVISAAKGAVSVVKGIGNKISSGISNIGDRLGNLFGKGATKTEEVVPNPFGKSGGPAHQGKIQDLAQEMRNKGYDVNFEKYVKTTGGNKSSRYGDILVTNPETGEQWIVQVGKQTQAGNPVSRELKAIEDLQNAGWRVDFNPYN